MEQKINVAELLENCPKGMELYSPIFGELKFNEVNAINNRILVVQQNGYIAEFESDGRLINCKNGECLLFPSKGKTTWDGFVPPCRFKDGDRVVKKGDISTPVSIVRVGDKYSYHYSNTEGTIGLLPIAEQDDWELVPTKFDITTLIPFESRVLMRSSNAMKWTAAFYSHKEGEYFAGCGLYCKQCVPYEGNEHLLGTTDDCNEYFKNWND